MLRIAAMLGAVLAACLAAAPALARTGLPTPEQRTSAHMAQLRAFPPLLRAFLAAMPKGADLHNHLSGAVYAESYIAWAIEAGLCIRLTDSMMLAPPCDAAAGVPPVADVARGFAGYGRLVDGLSLRNFVPGQGAPSGHDQFFATFFRFDLAEDGRRGDMLAEATARAARQKIRYMELMASPGMGAAMKLGSAVGWDDDLDALRTRVLARAEFEPILAAAREDLDGAEHRRRELLACGSAAPRPGCAVEVRFLAQVIRTLPREAVFAQSVLAFALVECDPRIVGLNFVAPEDDPRTLADYDDQMRMLRALGRHAPGVPIALHAGELALGLVPPEHLGTHIRKAVEIAGARRIGHGVDIGYDPDPIGLMRYMAAAGILVEVNLTSNETILGVSGKDHPFRTYRRFGVPMALSTDDEGVSRIDLTHEFQRVVETHDLDYRDVKALARNSLTYSFLPGASLWQGASPEPVVACAAVRAGDAAPPSAACAAFLAGSEKARAQWALEADFAAFEAVSRPQLPEAR